MSTLSGLTEDQDIKHETDSTGVAFGIVESGLYECTVENAYIKHADSGAIAVVLSLKTAQGNIIREDLWVQSGRAKGSKNFYVNAKGEKHYLPGFNMANSLCLLTAGKTLAEMALDKKIVKLWSSDAGAEVPTEVEVLVDLLDQPITAGVLKQTVDKTAKGDDGQYHPTGEHRDENTFDKFFRSSDRLTTAEIRAGATTAEFADRWDERNTGQTRDRTSKDIKSAGRPQAQSGAFANAAQTSGGEGAAPASGSIFKQST